MSSQYIHYTSNILCYEPVAYTLHTKNMISKLTTHDGRLKCRCLDTTYNVILYDKLY